MTEQNSQKEIMSQVNEIMGDIQNELEKEIDQFKEIIDSPSKVVEANEQKLVEQISMSLKALNDEISLLANNARDCFPQTEIEGVEIESIPEDTLNVFVGKCLERLTLMRVINQNVQEAYKTMSRVDEKKKKCDELLESYVNCTKAMQELVKN